MGILFIDGARSGCGNANIAGLTGMMKPIAMITQHMTFSPGFIFPRKIRDKIIITSAAADMRSEFWINRIVKSFMKVIPLRL